MKVRLLTKTTGVAEYEGKSIDEIIVGIARLSSSREVNDLFDEPHKLLRHCLLGGHWSIFSMANLTFEVTTSRAIGREYLRHWSLSFQETSQRYKSITEFEPIEIREQCSNNRQSSSNIFNPITLSDESVDIESRSFDHFEMTAEEDIQGVVNHANGAYKRLQDAGVARECARMILPESTQTTLIMNGKVRDWITTLSQRKHKTAQKEARDIANAIGEIFIQECPIISEMLYDFEDAYDIHILDRLNLEKWGVYDQIKANGFKKLKK